MLVRFVATAFVGGGLVSAAYGQSEDQTETQTQAEAEGMDQSGHAEASSGIVPLPDYSGELDSRRYLTGDWNGKRSELAENGIQFDLKWNQYIQGVASGGRDNATRYGGEGRYLVNFDLMRMGVMDGALVKLRAESRYGESVNGEAGPLLAANTDFLFPLTNEIDQSIPFTITTLSYTQYLSETFGVFLGKFDTLDGDANEFASGRGVSQFMNANLVFNSTLALRMPYSTLGGGLVWLPNEHIAVVSSIFNTADSSTTTGFQDFGDGLSWSTEANFQYRLGELPGGANVGALYSFDQDFTKIGGRFVFDPGQGLALEDEDSTWAVYASAWQYVWTTDGAEDRVTPGDGVPDYVGLGLFARLGFADPDTNPVDWSVSFGLGGRGLIPSRDIDTFGVGYFYNNIQTDRLIDAGLVEEQSQGVEAFYNLAMTPAARLTFDAQVLGQSSTQLDDAVLLGARLSLTF